MKTYPDFMNFVMNLIKHPELSVDLRGNKLGEGEEGNTFNHPHLIRTLQDAKFFEVDNDTVKLLQLTKPPKDLDTKIIKLPFRSIYIDADLGDIRGILAVEMSEKEMRFCVKRQSNSPEVQAKELEFYLQNKRGIYLYYKIDDGKNERHKWLINTPILIIGDKSLLESEGKIKNSKTTQRVKDFLYNFILFLNQPEVKVIDVHRSDKNRERAERHGKFPMPSTKVVKITGQLSKYVDELRSNGHFSYSHRFWVRGHFRTLRDPDRWGEKVGTRLWILPFIKGKGILINKEYLVKDKDSGGLKTRGGLHGN